VSQGFLTEVELMTYCVPKGTMSPVPTEGYVVSSVAFYKRGFDVPSHQLLCSLLQHYNLELHNLIPSRILHIAAFMALCEVYMGIDPYFDLYNCSFRVRHPQDRNAELTILGSVDIPVRSRKGVDLYFNIPMPKLMKGW
jgi:hypothetical protein